MEFIKVPRMLIEQQDIGDKRVLIFLSAIFFDWTGSCFDDFVEFCGYSKLNRHKDSAMDQVQDTLMYLYASKFLYKDAGNIVPVNRADCFGIIYRDEFFKIINYRKLLCGEGKRVNHAHVFLMLACVRCHMFHIAGRPRVYSNLLKRISNQIGISVRSLSNCIRTLEDLGILHSEELPRYKDCDGHWHSNVRIFVDRHDRTNSAYDWLVETRRGINMILASQLG